MGISTFGALQSNIPRSGTNVSYPSYMGHWGPNLAIYDGD